MADTAGGTATATGTARRDRDAAPRIAALRGAAVADVDPARLRAVAVAICVAAIVTTAVFLFVAGARRNAQVAALHDRGARVAATVTECQGQLGGSGFNFVGYACRGTYTLGRHRFGVAIPGSDYRDPGATLTLVADPAEPALVTTVAAARRDAPSAGVYLVPGALLAAGAGLGMGAGVRLRSGWPGSPARASRQRRRRTAERTPRSPG